MGAPIFLSHPASLEHDTGGAHPERAARIAAIERELAAHDWFGAQRREAAAADEDTLGLAHSAAHVESIRELSMRGGGWLDGDTVSCGAGSWSAALHAAGGAVDLVDALIDDDAPSGFAAGRPPGHHAESGRAMGFCLFNNIAIAAAHAVERRGVRRVLVLDWDVHHGNGTQEIFWSSPSVFYVSIHQSPLYPGSGHPAERGAGAGAGYTANLPVPSASGDEIFCSLIDHVVLPLAARYEPQLVLISAGFDAHAEDPLAGCTVTDRGYATMTNSILSLGLPVGVVLEGGYALDALARSAAATLAALAAPRISPRSSLTPLAAAARERLQISVSV
ncbi:MAG: histone deacetylase family protein [Solirubrobacteraceae bacterium]